ncbi:hypothetical protein EC957_007919 [Mortierella hygrophila]|uniref:Uncharacterized protein n=1 Tax=Mortierella hygrophila TaxID=979708 RepID=A0A9P6K5W0_9FUNG|nr:hypothetical protein EC957_007919 [Mortierella hygrophila]
MYLLQSMPQSRTFNWARDVVMSAETRVLPDRDRLSELYYQNRYLPLSMVQRERLVCEENTHIPHCLFLCNVVYYCGSITSANLADGEEDEEEFSCGDRILSRRDTWGHTSARPKVCCSLQTEAGLSLSVQDSQDESIDSIMKAYLARLFRCCLVYDFYLSAIEGGLTLINYENTACSDQYMLQCVHGWQLCREIRNYYNQIVQGFQNSEQFLFNDLELLDKSLVEWQEQLSIVLDILPTRESIASLIKAMATSAQLTWNSLIIFFHYSHLPESETPYTPFIGEQGGSPDSQGY